MARPNYGKSRTKQQRVDKKLVDVFDIYKDNELVTTFPEFSRLAADKMIENITESKKKRKRFIL